jgi:N-acetylneuraminic acid mutarotase
MNRRPWLLAGVCACALTLVAFIAAQAINVRETFGIDVRGAFGASSNPSPIDNACSRAVDITLPFGSASPAGHWQELPSSPVDQDEPRVAAVGGVVYIVGGLEQKRPGVRLTSVDTFTSYDTQRRTYTRLHPLPMRIDHPALVSVGGHVYMIGGYHDGRPLDVAYRYAPATETWTELAPMPTARGALAAAAIGDRIYAVGGVAGHIKYESDIRITSSPTLEIYDVRTNTWSSGSAPLVATHHAGAAALGGRVYVIGGRRPGDISLDVAQRYDPATNRWQRLRRLPYGSGGLQSVSDGRRVIAIGGGDSWESWVTPAVWAYDPASMRWDRLADLRVGRHGHGATTVGTTAYVFGGSPCQGFGGTSSAEMLDLGPTAR